MSGSESVYLLMFGSGLLGGFGHCSGMCGPIVAAYSLQLAGADDRAGRIIPHLLYNAGRLTTYCLIGGVMGLTGSFASVIQTIERFQSLTMAVIGMVMIFMGLSAAGIFAHLPDKLTGRRNPLRFLVDAIKGLMSYIASAKTSGSFYAIGLATGFIPCGLLYTAYIAAAGAGAECGGQFSGLLNGMLMLLFFGAGTVPSLLLIGRIASLKKEWIRRRLYRLAALLMIIIGALFIYRAYTS